MRMRAILFEPNAHYLASWRLNLGKGSLHYNDSIKIETGSQGKVIDIMGGSVNGGLDDAWDILTLTHEASEMIIDCRLHTVR